MIHFDKRGMGLSDQLVPMPTFETRIDDIRAVLEAEGMERVAFFGYGDGAALAATFAAAHPSHALARPPRRFGLQGGPRQWESWRLHARGVRA